MNERSFTKVMPLVPYFQIPVYEKPECTFEFLTATSRLIALPVPAFYKE
jgi:hypothetical protein